MLTNNGLKIMQCVYGGSLGGDTIQQYNLINTQGNYVQEWMCNVAVGSGTTSNANIYRGRLVFGTENIDITRSTYTLGNNMADIQINSDNSTVVSDTKSRVDVTLTNNTGSDVTYYTYGRCNVPTSGNYFLVSAYKFDTPIIVPANGSKNISLLFDLTNFELSVYAKPHDIKTTEITREITEQGVLQMPLSVTSYKLPEGVTDVGDYAMYYAFYKCGNIPTVDLSGLTTVSGQYALYNAFREAGVQSVNIPDLTTITGSYGMGQAFQANTDLQTVEFPKLVSIGKNAFPNTFTGCTNLTTVSFPELTTISDEYGFNNSFTNCTGLITVTFPKLTSLSNNAMYSCFENCTGITDVYFPALTTSSFPSGVGYGNTPLKIFNNVSGMNGKIHLPSNLSSIAWIQKSTTSSSSRQQYFGSDYCTVLLDLPATS